MNHPHPSLRAFLEDGPYAGETLSVEPTDSGEPPRSIVVEGGDGGDPGEVTDHIVSAAGTDLGPATYLLRGPDLRNGLWRYRCR
jgi:hypothetical protein